MSTLKQFGQDLKFLRESRNISIAEISAETRINHKFFVNFESGNFEFQPETYIRAFLKEYAECIGEDANIILYDYEKAKSGYYDRKFSVGEEPAEIEQVEKVEEKILSEIEEDANGQPAPSDTLQKKTHITPQTEQKKDGVSVSPRTVDVQVDEKNILRSRVNKKIFYGVLFLLAVGGIFFLINYLYKSEQPSIEVKPKSFSEISEDYENKLKGKTGKDSVNNPVIAGSHDSLTLTLKTAKTVRVQVYADEGRLVEALIPVGDSLVVKAKNQFRLTANANASIYIFLNGTLLQKPIYLTSPNLKDMIIGKEGIVTR